MKTTEMELKADRDLLRDRAMQLAEEQALRDDQSADSGSDD